MKQSGIELIAQERQEQIYKHGWSLERDAKYKQGELIQAARFCEIATGRGVGFDGDSPENRWPNEWSNHYRRKILGKTKIQALAVAGAFYMAENDRLHENKHQNDIDRLAAKIDKLQNQSHEEIKEEDNVPFHYELIQCPECNKVQKAKVEHTIPFATYVHECPFCKHIITESEWNKVEEDFDVVTERLREAADVYDFLPSDYVPSGQSPDEDLVVSHSCTSGNNIEQYVYMPVSIEDELPDLDEHILVSYDGGKTFPEEAAYRKERTCMLAGVGGGNGYFGEGFCTNGSTGCESGLILSDVTHWLKKVSLQSLLNSHKNVQVSDTTVAESSNADDHFEDGFELACQMLEDYAKYSTHSHNISDCLRAKRNKLPYSEVRLNPQSISEVEPVLEAPQSNNDVQKEIYERVSKWFDNEGEPLITGRDLATGEPIWLRKISAPSPLTEEQIAEIAEKVLLKWYGRPNQPFTDTQKKANKRYISALVEMYKAAIQNNK